MPSISLKRAIPGNNIVHHLGPFFRTIVPLILYFAIMWTSAFALIFIFTRYKEEEFGYEMAVVQSFTAGSNNFELAIAIAIAVYGVDSQQALAATVGPYVCFVRFSWRQIDMVCVLAGSWRCRCCLP